MNPRKIFQHILLMVVVACCFAVGVSAAGFILYSSSMSFSLVQTQDAFTYMSVAAVALILTFSIYIISNKRH